MIILKGCLACRDGFIAKRNAVSQSILQATHSADAALACFHAGGPCSDIVVAEDTPQGPQPTGYLAATEAEYAAAMTEVLAMGQVERMALAGRAQRRSAAFSTDRFTQDFSAIVRPLLPR